MLQSIKEIIRIIVLLSVKSYASVIRASAVSKLHDLRTNLLIAATDLYPLLVLRLVHPMCVAVPGLNWGWELN